MEKKFTLILLIPFLFVIGCSTTQPTNRNKVTIGSTKKVRTTAYTHTEAGGRKNALGTRLAAGTVKSAAADWSRFPVGTKFQILTTGEIYQVDDYGSALIGTETIDLYKPSRMTMHNWGVRMVDIKILEWGSPEKSIALLQPRMRNAHVRAMVASLQQL
ncbi:MAG: 3D domain-containing protein [Verrucomicrobiota bacterium]